MAKHPLVLDHVVTALEEIDKELILIRGTMAAMSHSLVRMHVKQIELEAVMAREGVGGSSIILPN